MKNIAEKFFLFAIVPLLLFACHGSQQVQAGKIPGAFLGKFTDDYGINYTVSGKLFLQEPGVKYHVLKWNVKKQYIIAKNDAGNPSEKNLYSRIDYMNFEHMEPFTWGFCLTVYNARDDKAAEQAAAADRGHPMKGCGGFPFSRLKRRE